MPRHRAGEGLMLLPGVLVVALALDAGGVFPGGTSRAALVLATVLAVRALVAERPFEGWTARAGVVLAALAAFAGWVLLSRTWSGAPGQAVLEFDRAVLYL